MSNTRNILIKKIEESIDIPAHLYEKAIERYTDLGKWLNDPQKAACARYGPEVRSQGSFRLGTVNRPLARDEDYDLDLTLALSIDLTKLNITQEQLKELVRKDLEAYRKERGIQSELDEKPRCWTFIYKDQIGFHMDVVPAIPEDEQKVAEIARLISQFEEMELASASRIAEVSVAITDNRRSNYSLIDGEWEPSNPRGFARWFESRMKKAEKHLESIRKGMAVASIEQVPAHSWKTTLQRTIQIMKRHRDVFFKDRPECAPTSVVITTLAARAYSGENTIEEALIAIASDFENYVCSSAPFVTNPTNPNEDFADKWNTEKGKRLGLKDHFYLWASELKKDLEILERTDSELISKHLQRSFAVSVAEDELESIPAFGLSRVHVTSKPRSTPLNKPWAR